MDQRSLEDEVRQLFVITDKLMDFVARLEDYHRNILAGDSNFCALKQEFRELSVKMDKNRG